MMKAILGKLNVYLAGKVSRHKWDVVQSLKGKYSFSATDGSNHSEHDWGYCYYDITDETLRSEVRRCFSDISQYDCLVAYLHRPDSFGSIAEMSWFAAKGMPVLAVVHSVSGNGLESGHHADPMFDAYWFVCGFPNIDVVEVDTEAEATRAIDNWLYRRSYKSYLASPEWSQRRKVALSRSNYQCALCSSTSRLQVHHRTYRNVGNELQGDLIVLCANCHERHHDKVESREAP